MKTRFERSYVIDHNENQSCIEKGSYEKFQEEHAKRELGLHIVNTLTKREALYIYRNLKQDSIEEHEYPVYSENLVLIGKRVIYSVEIKE